MCEREQEKADAEAGIEKLLQKLPVSDNLLFFYGEGCTFTTRVQPEIRCELMPVVACPKPAAGKPASVPATANCKYYDVLTCLRCYSLSRRPGNGNRAANHALGSLA